MSKIRLHGSSSGYTEIAPVAASGNNTLTLPNDGTIISKDSNGAVGVTSITVGTGVTIGDGRVTCTTVHGSAASLTQIPAANIVGVCTSGLTKTGGFGALVPISATTVSSNVSSVTFTEQLTGAFSDYKIYVVMISGMKFDSDNEDLYVRYRTGSNGSSQQATNVYLAMTNGAESADTSFSATSQWRMNYNNIGNETDGSYVKEDFNAVIYFYGFEANRRLRYHGQTTYQSSDGNLRGQFINGHATDSTEVTGLEFFPSASNNISVGKFSLFGVNG